MLAHGSCSLSGDSMSSMEPAWVHWTRLDTRAFRKCMGLRGREHAVASHVRSHVDLLQGISPYVNVLSSSIGVCMSAIE